MSRTLYVSDLDGTLLGTDSRVSPESAAIISRLTRAGALFTVATARTPATVEPLLRHTLTTGPAVVMTGATLWDRQRQDYVETRFIKADNALAIRRIIESHGLFPFIYTLAGDGILHAYHNGPLAPVDRKFIDDRRNLPLKRFHIDDPRGNEPTLPDTLIFFAMGDPDSIFAAARDLESDQEKLPCSVSAYIDIFGNDVGVLEVKAAGTSKAISVKQLAEYHDADRIVAFGDNLNDLPMFDVATVAVAVGNAVPEVKEAADIVIGPNSADSVARFVEEDFIRHHNIYI